MPVPGYSTGGTNTSRTLSGADVMRVTRQRMVRMKVVKAMIAVMD